MTAGVPRYVTNPLGGARMPSYRRLHMSNMTERVVGAVKTAAGAVTGNDDLKREGALHAEKAEATVEAAKLETEAERETAQAELVAREKQIETERQRIAAE